MFEMIIAGVIAVLVIVYVWLRKSQRHEQNLPVASETKLPAVSEDVNLPAVSAPNPPMTKPNDNQQPQQ